MLCIKETSVSRRRNGPNRVVAYIIMFGNIQQRASQPWSCQWRITAMISGDNLTSPLSRVARESKNVKSASTTPYDRLPSVVVEKTGRCASNLENKLGGLT